MSRQFARVRQAGWRLFREPSMVGLGSDQDCIIPAWSVPLTRLCCKYLKRRNVSVWKGTLETLYKQCISPEAENVPDPAIRIGGRLGRKERPEAYWELILTF